MKSLIKKTMTAAGIIAVFTSSSASAVSVTVNGDKVSFDSAPVIMNDRTMVPMRAIFEVLGADVNWNGDTRTVTAVRGDDTVSLTIGTDVMTVNGKSVSLDAAPVIVNDRTLVPVRAISEALGCEVGWNGVSQTVRITDKSGLVKADNLDKYKSLNVYEVMVSPQNSVDVMYDINLDGVEEAINFRIFTPPTVNGMYDPSSIIMTVNGVEYELESSTALSTIRAIYILDADVTDNAKEILVLHDCNEGVTIQKYEKGSCTQIWLSDFNKKYSEYKYLIH